jgi:dUTP pyrophosphatase
MMDNFGDEFKKLEEEISNFQKENDEGDWDIKKILNDAGLDIDLESLKPKMEDYIQKFPLKYKKIHPDAINPEYNYKTDSGFDLYSTEEIVIGPLGRALIPTGICFDIVMGQELQVRSKSGLAINQGLFVLNSPGTVDAGYTGEVKVIIFNTNNFSVTIKKGMKVAQGVICPIISTEWLELIEVSEIKEKDRNSNGFGSTGI